MCKASCNPTWRCLCNEKQERIEVLGTVANYFLFYKSANRTFGLPVSFRLNKAEAAKELNCADLPK